MACGRIPLSRPFDPRPASLTASLAAFPGAGLSGP